MTDRESVIAGLEDSLAYNSCGFIVGIGEMFAVSGEDLRHAIDLLKAQEPCVMTLEEFQESSNNPKWLETKDGKISRWTLGNAGYDKFYDEQMLGYLNIGLYSKEWRCWTSKPTDEQRQNEPWKE